MTDYDDVERFDDEALVDVAQRKLEMVRQIGERRGFGVVLAEGSARAAAIIGRGAGNPLKKGALSDDESPALAKDYGSRKRGSIFDPLVDNQHTLKA